MPEFHELAGRTLPPLTVCAERGQLRFFASVLGIDDPIYTDVAAARSAGLPDLLIPPTFYFSLELQRENPYAVLHEFGFDTREFLHGEEAFTYHAPACAGQELTFDAAYTDCFEKKGGTLKFIERTTRVSRNEEPIAELRNVLIIRRSEDAA